MTGRELAHPDWRPRLAPTTVQRRTQPPPISSPNAAKPLLAQDLRLARPEGLEPPNLLIRSQPRAVPRRPGKCRPATRNVHLPRVSVLGGPAEDWVIPTGSWCDRRREVTRFWAPSYCELRDYSLPLQR
jgi:hypothetical protein